MRRALEGSLNTATVRVAQAVGLPVVIETARTHSGMEVDLKPVPALTLGVFEITPLALARAYLPLANGACAASGGVVETVARRRRARALEREPRGAPGDRRARGLPGHLAAEGVINVGTAASARAAGVPGAVAGKTGTTNEGRDAWFVGYSPNLLALVWVGFDDGTPAGLSGAEGALPIWSEFMRQALDIYPGGAFPEPAGITHAKVDVTTGPPGHRVLPARRRPRSSWPAREPPPCEEHGGSVTEQVERWWDKVRGWFGK